MQASVTTKVMDSHPAGAPSQRAALCRKTPRAPSRGAASNLRFRHAHDEPVELFGQHDLAAQTTGRRAVEHAVEHAVFLRVRRRQFAGPLGSDVYVARRARARAAAFGDDAID